MKAVGIYSVPDDHPICNLDDPQTLLDLNLRPSGVVTRDYEQTRRWARRIWEREKWCGVSWWSYHDPRWASLGLWNIEGVRVQSVRQLHLNDADLIEASQIIVRPIVVGKRKPIRNQ